MIWATVTSLTPCSLENLSRSGTRAIVRSEEHTSELQSHRDLHSFPTRRSSDLLRLEGVTVLDDLGHRHQLDAVLPGEPLEVGYTGHRAILFHDLADHTRRLEPGHPGEVDGGLCLAGALQDTTGLRPQREYVSWHHDVFRAGRLVHGDPAGVGPVGGGYARRDALLRLDRGRERCTHPRSVVGDHLWYVEAVDDLPRHRKADQTATVDGHEVDVVRSNKLGGHGQVALVLTVLVVTNDDHLALLDVLDDLLYRAKRHLRHSSRRLKVSLPGAARAAALRTYL